MKKFVKCFIHHNADISEPGFEAWSMEMTGSGRLHLVATVDVEFEVPDDFDPRPAQIARLQLQRNTAAAHFHALDNEFLRQINDLQALEMR